MFYDFQVLHKILPKLNSVHVSNNKHIQLVGQTLLQLLERFFFPGRRTRSIITLTNHFFSRASLETSNEIRLYLLKLYLSYFTDLSYQYIVPSKYCVLNILQLCSIDFLSIYQWFHLQLSKARSIFNFKRNT